MAGQVFNTGYGTMGVNDQLIPVLTYRGLRPPITAAPNYMGRGAVPPTLPGGVSNAGSSNAVAAAANPFDIRLSPVIWMVGFLFLGILGLRYVHWRG